MPKIDENGKVVYSKAEYGHLNFMQIPFEGFVEGVGYTFSKTVTVPVPVNESKTEIFFNTQTFQIDFSIPSWANIDNFANPVNRKSDEKVNGKVTKTQEAAGKSSNTPASKSLRQKIGEFLMDMVIANVKADAKTGELLIRGSQHVADKAIPHSWADSPNTSDLVADLIVTTEFFTGTGPQSRVFGPEMQSTKSLMNSHLTHVAYNQYLNLPDSTILSNPQISVGFNPIESHGSGPFSEANYDYYFSSPVSLNRRLRYNTAQFVGSAKYYFNINGDSIEVTVTNTTNIRSAFYHIPGLGTPRRNETPFGIMGTVDQTYRYKISKEDMRKKANRKPWED